MKYKWRDSSRQIRVIELALYYQLCHTKTCDKVIEYFFSLPHFFFFVFVFLLLLFLLFYFFYFLSFFFLYEYVLRLWNMARMLVYYCPLVVYGMLWVLEGLKPQGHCRRDVTISVTAIHSPTAKLSDPTNLV